MTRSLTICLALLLWVAPAAALSVEQVLALRAAGVSDQAIRQLIENEIQVKRQGGMGRYQVRTQGGRNFVVYEASSGGVGPRMPVEDLGPRGDEAASRILVTELHDGSQVVASQGGGARAAGAYTLHVGSFQKRSHAQDLVGRLAKKGQTGRIKEVDLGDKGHWFRVYAGDFSSREQAEATGRQLSQDQVVDYYKIMDR